MHEVQSYKRKMKLTFSRQVVVPRLNQYSVAFCFYRYNFNIWYEKILDILILPKHFNPRLRCDCWYGSRWKRSSCNRNSRYWGRSLDFSWGYVDIFNYSISIVSNVLRGQSYTSFSISHNYSYCLCYCLWFGIFWRWREKRTSCSEIDNRVKKRTSGERKLWL